MNFCTDTSILALQIELAQPDEGVSAVMGLGLSVPSQGATELDVLGLVVLCWLDVVGYHDDRWMFAACAGALWRVFPQFPPMKWRWTPGARAALPPSFLPIVMTLQRGRRLRL